VTSRARFGDFLDAAWRHLDPVSAAEQTVKASDDVAEVSRSLLRLVVVMSRYIGDITATVENMPTRCRPPLNNWARAAIEARDAMATSASFLQRDGSGGGRWPSTTPLSPLARRLDAVTVSLGTGRDLLLTHFAPGRKSGQEHRSEWSSVIVSPQVTRALLTEIGALGREVAQQVADFALSPWGRAVHTGDGRRRLNAACQWLWVLHASTQAAQQHEPASTADHELLCAMPLNALPPRRVPNGSERVDQLCDGLVDCAERVRHGAWGLAERAAWSPGMSLASLRQVALASTATSHHCHVILETLAARTGEAGQIDLAADLSAAAAAAGHARGRWLRVGQALRRFMTDTSAYVSRAAAEAADLALWTGRLAYADPGWRPSHGPSHIARTPAELAGDLHHVPQVIAAVHYACETLAALAQADREQIRAGADVGRILVPTQSLPDDFDVPHPFAHAPPDRVDYLLDHYRQAGHASRQASSAVGRTAAATRAPSRILTAVRAAIATGHNGGATRSPDVDHAVTEPAAEPDSTPSAGESAGPVERTLVDLGVTRPELLRQGTKIDQAAERLIFHAAEELEPEHRRPDATVLSRSRGTATLINHALLSGDPRAASLLRRQPRRQPEREPES
jgi:hypothetical protein